MVTETLSISFEGLKSFRITLDKVPVTVRIDHVADLAGVENVTHDTQLEEATL
jgi:hypothetical protein